MQYQHFKQLIEMRDEFSRKYKINFKYIKESDLKIPLELIKQYRDEEANRPKPPSCIRRLLRRIIRPLHIRNTYQ